MLLALCCLYMHCASSAGKW